MKEHYHVFQIERVRTNFAVTCRLFTLIWRKTQMFSCYLVKLFNCEIILFPFLYTITMHEYFIQRRTIFFLDYKSIWLKSGSFKFCCSIKISFLRNLNLKRRCNSTENLVYLSLPQFYMNFFFNFHECTKKSVQKKLH